MQRVFANNSSTLYMLQFVICKPKRVRYMQGNAPFRKYLVYTYTKTNKTQ